MVASIGYGLAAAELAELTLRRRVRVDENRLVMADSEPTGDADLDRALSTLRGSPGERSPQGLVWTLAGDRKNRYLDRLMLRGLLGEEGSRLGVFTRRGHRVIDEPTKAELHTRLRTATRATGPPDDRTRALLSIASACNLTDGLVDDAGRAAARARIAELARGEPFGAAVRKVISGAALSSTGFGWAGSGAGGDGGPVGAMVAVGVADQSKRLPCSLRPHQHERTVSQALARFGGLVDPWWTLWRAR